MKITARALVADVRDVAGWQNYPQAKRTLFAAAELIEQIALTHPEVLDLDNAEVEL